MQYPKYLNLTLLPQLNNIIQLKYMIKCNSIQGSDPKRWGCPDNTRRLSTFESGFLDFKSHSHYQLYNNGEVTQSERQFLACNVEKTIVNATSEGLWLNEIKYSYNTIYIVNIQ